MVRAFGSSAGVSAQKVVCGQSKAVVDKGLFFYDPRDQPHIRGHGWPPTDTAIRPRATAPNQKTKLRLKARCFWLSVG